MKYYQAKWNPVANITAPIRNDEPTVYHVEPDLFGIGLGNKQLAGIWGVMAACRTHIFLVHTMFPQDLEDFCDWLEEHEGGGYETARKAAIARLRRRKECSLPVSLSPVPWPVPNVWAFLEAFGESGIESGIQSLLEANVAHRGLILSPLHQRVDLREWLWCERCRESPWGLGTVDSPENYEGGGKPWLTCGCQFDDNRPRIEQVILGGDAPTEWEQALPYDLSWAADVIDQCREAMVPVFHERIGSLPYVHIVQNNKNKFAKNVDYRTKSRTGENPEEWPKDLRVRELAWAPKSDRPAEREKPEAGAPAKTVEIPTEVPEVTEQMRVTRRRFYHFKTPTNSVETYFQKMGSAWVAKGAVDEFVWWIEILPPATPCGRYPGELRINHLSEDPSFDSFHVTLLKYSTDLETLQTAMVAELAWWLNRPAPPVIVEKEED